MNWTRHDVEELVGLGVQRLDDKLPGWEEGVDADALRMASTDLCILGQVSRWDSGQHCGYMTGLQLVDVEHEQAHRYGFDRNRNSDAYKLGADRQEEWELLDDVWKRTIRRRKEAATVA
jgi:hypothetical protein